MAPTPPSHRRIAAGGISAAVLLTLSACSAASGLVGDEQAAAPGNGAHDHDHGGDGHGGTVGDSASHTHGSHDAGTHAAAMALVADELASHRAVADGPWSDPATWGGQVPADGARVIIPEGRVVEVDTRLPARIETVGVHGTLRFATNVDTELLVDTVISSPTGRLEIGTAERPIADGVVARMVFIDDGPIDRAVDPKQLGRGAVLHGSTAMYGAETTHRTVLAGPARAGDTAITLTGALTGWGRGDQIAITGTQGPTSDELRTISAIEGNTVRFEQPLQLDHVPPRSDLAVWVANTTRNIIIESENDEVPRRGHVMFMHTHDVDVNNVRFDHLGRTDKSIELDDVDFGETVTEGGHQHDGSFTKGEATNIRARYSVHVHRGGTDPDSKAALIRGSVVFDDPGWAFVNHSSNVDFVDNVSYEARGVGFMTEAGDEVGSMVGNIAIRSVMPNFELNDGNAIDPDLRANLQDYGWQGDGFWLQGNRVSVIDNVSAGASAHGIIYWSEGLVELSPDPDVATNSMIDVSTLPDPSLVPDREKLHVWWAPLAEVSNNTSYGATVGFRSRYVHAGGYLEDPDLPPQAYIDSLDPVVDGLVIWDVRDGVLLNYNERLSLRNADVIGRGHPFDHNLFATAAVGVGLDLGNEVTRGPGRVENVRITGFEMGVIAPRNDDWRLSNLRLGNQTDMLIHGLREDHRNLDMSSIEFVSLDGTAMAGRDGQRRNIVMEPWFVGLDENPSFLLAPDRITLDGQQLFFDIQAADAVPVTPGRLDDELGEDDETERAVACRAAELGGSLDGAAPEAGTDESGDEDGEEFDEDEFADEDGEEFDEDEFADEDGEEFDEDEFADDDDEEGNGGEELTGLLMGCTNADLIEHLGGSFGGALMPEGARAVPWLVNGKIA